MKTYKIWTHLDTGIMQEIKANSESEALELAEENISILNKNMKKQIFDNLQTGESDIQ